MSRFANIGRKAADDLEDSEEFGNILENILEGKPKSNVGQSASKGKYASKLSMSDSFDNSVDSLPTPSKYKRSPVPSPTAAKAPSGFDDSGEFDVDIDENPTIRKTSTKFSSPSVKKDPKPIPNAPSSSTIKAEPAVAESSYSSTFLTGGREKDDDSGDIGFVPSILQGRQPRQRRQLNVTSANPVISSRPGTGASLDELDRMIGTGSKKDDFRRQPMSLTADSDSEDEKMVTYTASSVMSRQSSEEESYRGKAPSRVEIPDAVADGSPDARGGSTRSTGASIDPSPRRTNTAQLSNPAWLSSSTPGPKTVSSSQSPPQHAEREHIRVLQQQAEASQLEREAVERQYKLEIDTLKGKLTRGGYTSAIGDEQIREMGEGTVRQQREVSDLRRTIAQLEMEIARLKDEGTLSALRHHEETKYAREKHVQELSDLDRRKEEEIVAIERRHAEAVLALKRIHNEEISAIKERSKDGFALDQLAGQLKSTSGSIKLLEEQLVSKYRGLDAAKDGQMEARERLLAEMEEKARLRAETAEAEGYRLKGLLMHMEHVATSLRSQGSEEKERLRHEHQRLHSMQLALEAERHALQARCSEELSLLKTKMAETEAETQRLNNEKRLHSETVAGAQRALDSDRAEFAAYLMTHTRTAEATSERLAEEEARLSRVREELSRERTLLEQRKAAAAGDLQDAERLRLDVQAGRDQTAREKAALQQAVRELQTASENLARQGESIDIQARAMADREISYRETAARLKLAASSLSKREAELNARVKEMESRLVSISESDRDLTNKKLSIAQANRELMSKNAAAAISAYSLPIPYAEPNKENASVPNKPLRPGSSLQQARPPQPEDQPSAWLEAFQQRVRQGMASSVQGSVNRNVQQPVSDRYTQEQVFDARKLLQNARGVSVQSNSTRDRVDRLLSQESSFISTMQAHRARASLAQQQQQQES